ncbi:hypothetical protein DF164_31180 [Burkholderia stagnalis]|nr:hypothetical protein DF164_31180 [Burkholderia stagnalis]RQY64921.1 hypothetical protein DF110_30705 [Burkholderia stagnalis]
MDSWDVMSTLSAFSAPDSDYAARGPGINAWNMRSRGWLDESRIWKAAPNTDFSEVVQLRALHQRALPGWLGAELPGIGNHSPYLVELRLPELWDAGLPQAAVLVHRFSGEEENGQVYSPGLLGQALKTHSYIMKGLNGQFSLSVGDIFEIGNGPFARVKVLQIDRANRNATVQLCYSSLPKPALKVKIRTPQYDGCSPVLIEGAIVKFDLAIDGLTCSQGYSVVWSVAGASPVAGQQLNSPTLSLTLPVPSVQVSISATVTLDDGPTASAALQFNPISQDEARLLEFLCMLLRERLKPIPWWEWDPEKLRAIAAEYSREELVLAVRGLENTLQVLKAM